METQFDVNKELVDLRASTKDDLAFVISTWLKGLRFGNEFYSLVNQKVYFSVYHKVLTRILEKPSVKIQIACLKDDPTVILGYAVYEGKNLHWVFVKKIWRKIGIAKSLVPKEISVATHITKVGKAILFKKGLIFNPFLL